MLEVEIEFMDGVVRKYPGRFLIRHDKDNGVFRMLYNHEEVEFPMVNIRRLVTRVIPDEDPKTTTDKAVELSKEVMSKTVDFTKKTVKEMMKHE